MVLMIVAGCGPKGEAVPEAAPPPAPAPPPTATGTGNTPDSQEPDAPTDKRPEGIAGLPGKPSTKAPPQVERSAKMLSLPVDRATGISVELERRSLAVVEYYDRALAGRGWKKREPKGEDDPGQREWIEMPVPAGPSDLYDAAWIDPKSGRTAVLNLFHTKEQPELQQGSFDIYAKGQAPWKQ